MKRIIIVLLPLLLCLVSCSAPVYELDDNSDWVEPVIFDINDYYTGANVSKTEVLFHVHCSDLPRTEYTKWLVETFDQETEVEFTLKAPLADYDTDKVSVISSDLNETIQLITYNPATNTILVGGFLPNSKRYVEVRYPAWTRYVIQPIEPYKNNLSKGYKMPPEGFVKWVTVDNPVIILKPGETKDIRCYLDVPVNVTIEAQKWEYWVEVYEAPIGEVSGVGISASTRIRCKVSMKG